MQVTLFSHVFTDTSPVTVLREIIHFTYVINASSESWINNIYIDVWFVMIGQYL